jgi:hypothetical protein
VLSNGCAEIDRIADRVDELRELEVVVTFSRGAAEQRPTPPTMIVSMLDLGAWLRDASPATNVESSPPLGVRRA